MLEKSKESRRHWTKAQKEAILREYDHGSDSLAVFAGFLRAGRSLRPTSAFFIFSFHFLTKEQKTKLYNSAPGCLKSGCLEPKNQAELYGNVFSVLRKH